MTDDTISRQAAIDALKGIEFCVYMDFGEYIGEDTREVRLIRAEKAQDALQNLPSAQPEQCEELDFVQEHKKIPVVLDIQQKGKNMPSAQPEQCEDAVHVAYKHGKSKGIKKGLSLKQPERKLGRWIEAGSEDGYWYKCSECGKWSDWEDPFCRECGSKMESGEQE